MHYEPPPPPNGPATLVQDAIFLDRNRTFEGGASLVSRYSGLKVNIPEQQQPRVRRPPALRVDQRLRGNLSPASRSGGSPGRSPARFLSSQKGLETLFQEVSGNLQRRTEGWNVSKAVRAAAGGVRRNVNHFQSGTASPRNSLGAVKALPSQLSTRQDTPTDLRRRLAALEKRNKSLARMLADALEELRAQKQFPDSRPDAMGENHFNIALAKLQFVQVYLDDPDIPIPGHDELLLGEMLEGQPVLAETNSSEPAMVPEDLLPLATPGVVAGRSSPTPVAVLSGEESKAKAEEAEADKGNHPKEVSDHGRYKPSTPPSSQRRPALAQSHLSWMLGEGHHRSDFVSSSTPPPEQRRDSVSGVKSKRLFAEGKDFEGRNGCENEDDAFTMRSFHGSQSND